MGITVDQEIYLLSLPERLVRSAFGLWAGIAREIGEVVLPDRLKQTQLYQNLVDTTLRFLIEQVGQVDGVYPADAPLGQDFLKRRAAGNAIEALGIVAFRASPVWVLAALADVCGMGRQLIPEIADALKEEGLLDRGHELLERRRNARRPRAHFRTRLAATVNTPPLDVSRFGRNGRPSGRTRSRLQPQSLPSPAAVADLWRRLQSEAERQHRSIFETSSMLAVSAIKAVPEGARWLTASARLARLAPGRSSPAAARSLPDRRSTRSGKSGTRRSPLASSARMCARPSDSSLRNE